MRRHASLRVGHVRGDVPRRHERLRWHLREHADRPARLWCVRRGLPGRHRVRQRRVSLSDRQDRLWRHVCGHDWRSRELWRVLHELPVGAGLRGRHVHVGVPGGYRRLRWRLCRHVDRSEQLRRVRRELSPRSGVHGGIVRMSLGNDRMWRSVRRSRHGQPPLRDVHHDVRRRYELRGRFVHLPARPDVLRGEWLVRGPHERLGQLRRVRNDVHCAHTCVRRESVRGVLRCRTDSVRYRVRDHGDGQPELRRMRHGVPLGRGVYRRVVYVCFTENDVRSDLH